MSLLVPARIMARMFREARHMNLDPEIDFDEERFMLEKLWIKKRKAGELLLVETKADSILSIISMSILWTLLFGTMLSLILLYIFKNLISVGFGYSIVFFILMLKFNEPYAKTEIDLNSENFLYDGIIEYGGTLRKTRYLGDIRVIEASQIVKIGRKRFLRFITNSGYLRLPPPEKLPLAVKHKLEELNLIPKTNVNVLSQGKTVVLAEEKYDREEYFTELQKKKEERAEKRRIARTQKLEEEYKKQQNK